MIDDDVVPTVESKEVVVAVIDALAALGVADWNEENIGNTLRAMCKQHGWKPGKTIPIAQHAIMGQRYGTSLFRVADEIGRYQTLQRLWSWHAEIQALESNSVELNELQPPDYDSPAI